MRTTHLVPTHQTCEVCGFLLSIGHFRRYDLVCRNCRCEEPVKAPSIDELLATVRSDRQAFQRQVRVEEPERMKLKNL